MDIILDKTEKLPWYQSIRWKLALSYMALSVVPLIIFNFTIITAIEDYYMSSRIDEVRHHAVRMSGVVAHRGFSSLEQPQTLSVFRVDVNNRREEWGVRILVINDSARVIADSHEDTLLSHVGNILLSREVLYALAGNDTMVVHRDERVLHVAVNVQDPASDRVWAVLLISPVDDIFDSLSDIQTTLLLYSLAVGLLVVVVVFLTSHRLIMPLRRIMQVVQKMTTGQISLRIPVVGKSEYAILATAFNDMTDKLDQVEKTREEFVSNVSHEMKTPLSSIKVLCEAILLQEHVPEEMYREFLQDINSEVERMTNINNDLLALVKIDQREQGLNIQLTDINELVEDILKRLYHLAEQRKVVLLYEQVRPVQIEADEIKLSLAISNIVENGIKYTPRGGTVKVVVDSDHQFLFITIQDTGIGIPEEEQDKIFNRFYRVDKTRDRETGGTGLGLAISRSTVLLHNGSIRVNSKADEGSVFVMRIPLRR